MAENTFLLNGRFLHNLDGWTASGGASYDAGDADEHYGVCILPVGGSISQDFAVIGVRRFTLHVAVKATAALSSGQCTLSIVDGSGNTVVSVSLSGGTAWTENEFTYGLAEGTTYTLTISNVSAAGNVKVDDIWLWHIPVTRAQIAESVHHKLGRLALDRGLTTSPSGTLTEGSYTYAIDAALRFIGAIDPDTGSPSVRWVDEQSAQTVIDATEKQMLEQLRLDYVVEVDTSTGPFSQQLSQKAKTLDEILSGSSTTGASSSNAPVVQRRLNYD